MAKRQQLVRATQLYKMFSTHCTNSSYTRPHSSSLYLYTKSLKHIPVTLMSSNDPVSD